MTDNMQFMFQVFQVVFSEGDIKDEVLSNITEAIELYLVVF